MSSSSYTPSRARSNGHRSPIQSLDRIAELAQTLAPLPGRRRYGRPEVPRPRVRRSRPRLHRRGSDRQRGARPDAGSDRAATRRPAHPSRRDELAVGGRSDRQRLPAARSRRMDPCGRETVRRAAGAISPTISRPVVKTVPTDVGVTGIWNIFTKLALPMLALVYLALSGHLTTTYILAAIFDVVVLGVAVGLFAALFRSEAFAIRSGTGWVAYSRGSAGAGQLLRDLRERCPDRQAADVHHPAVHVGKPIADHSPSPDRAERGYACEEINLLPIGTVDVDKDVPGALIVTRGSETSPGITTDDRKGRPSRPYLVRPGFSQSVRVRGRRSAGLPRTRL
jgi:hypothetical protein